MVFFYLVTTGCIFDTSLREISINQSINRDKNSMARERWEDPCGHRQDGNVAVGGIGNLAR